MQAPEQQDVGICGVRLVDDDGRPTTSAARFPSLRSLFGDATALSRVLPSLFPPHLLSASECDTTRDVDQVIGAFFLIRRHVFEALGGFDERFFVYYEEVDLSLRARQRGHRLMALLGRRGVPPRWSVERAGEGDPTVLLPPQPIALCLQAFLAIGCLARGAGDLRRRMAGALRARDAEGRHRTRRGRRRLPATPNVHPQRRVARRPRDPPAPVGSAILHG